MLHRLRIPVLLLAAALAAAATAPDEAEWAPVAKALEAGGAEAVAAVEAIASKYPKWPDGQRALASAKLAAGDARGAWSAARAALGLNPKDAAAAALGIQALTVQARFDDAFKVADMFKTPADDPGGAVAMQAAICALVARRDDALKTYLDAAKERAGGSSPVLDFIAAKRAQRGKDLAGAAGALERAIAAKPDYRDALYELGRVRTVQAFAEPDQADARLAKAEDCFVNAAKLDAKDADSRFGLGRARLERGKRLLAAGKADEGGAMLRSALQALDEGLQLQPANRDGKLWKGDALLRLERFDEAVPMLKQAFAAGATDRALPFNLSFALARSGKTEEAAKALENVEANSTDERLVLAMNAFGAGNWGGAQKLFVEARDEIGIATPEEAKRRFAVLRYLGHCARELAATAQGERQEELLEEAAGYYKMAGDNDDFAARHWYLHVQAGRSPLLAFDAGKQAMRWDGFWNPGAWQLLAANYGWKVSHGEGLAGALKHGPAHLMLWALLAFIPIGLFLKGWLLPHGLYGGGKAKPAGAKPSARAPAAGKPGGAPARKPATAAARKPGTASTGKPPSRALTPKDGTGPKTPFSE